MPIVQEILQLPHGDPLDDVYIEISLVASLTDHGAPGYEAGTHIAGVASVAVSDTGFWQAALRGNALLEPEGTVYKITRRGPGAYDHTRFIVMPNSGGPYTVEELLTTPPEEVPSILGSIEDRIDSTHADVVADLVASGGVNLEDLDPWTVPTTFSPDNNLLLVRKVAQGVDQKASIESLLTHAPVDIALLAPGDTAYSWTWGKSLIYCPNTSALTITLPTHASAPGFHSPVMVVRAGTGTVTMAAGSSAVINKPSDRSLELRAQHSVAFFRPIAWVGGSTIYVAYGDLGP